MKTEKSTPISTWEPGVAEILKEKCLQHAKLGMNTRRPYLVSISGLPGSGKSTSAHILQRLVDDCLVLPMDGYHYPLAVLKRMENPSDKIYRRGAPDTFDAERLRRDLLSIRNEAENGNEGSRDAVKLPGFDHAAGDPEENAYCFSRGKHKVVIMEGLYMLHQAAGWKEISNLFDYKIFIDSDVDKCVATLKTRNKCIPGYTPEEIEMRCDQVDRENAMLVKLDKPHADLVVSSITS
mmetsp:Transcript_12254/g.13936  ORF Transcript_12254/g.13936 Transcript_12254/m.13936 type:complete len:237 (+) Transcript_12254:114-824(+)